MLICLTDRKHVSYELKDGVAVVRFNTPGSKVRSRYPHGLCNSP